MKRIKLSPLLTSAMALQMIMSPVAYAINPLEAINMAGQIMMANQQNIAAQRNAMANQQMVAEMTRPGRDKYFNTDSLARIPGLMEYMARNGLNPQTLTCPTLPTTVTEIRAEVCRIGMTNDRGAAPQAQLSEMFSLYKTYGDVAKQYEAYSSISNAEGQGFGVGCMRNALQTLSGFFAYRTNELDKLTTNLEALQNQFREASKVDLNAIEEATAVLDGGNSELADEVRTRRPDLFDFGKRFDNPACKSMFAGDSFNTFGNGSPGGLNQINKRLKDQFSAKLGKYSGESYIGAHATVVDDINKMADKAAQQFQLNFTSITSDDRGYGEFLANLKNTVSSSTGVKDQLLPDFFADAQLAYNKQNNAIISDLTTLRNELSAAGADPSGALRIVNNLNAKNFESEVALVQNQIRNKCLDRAFAGSGFWDRIKKNIIDPTGSKFANKNEFNPLRERIEDIMTDTRLTPEAKLQALRDLESQNGGRFILRMQGSYQRTIVGADGRTTTQSVSPSAVNAPSTFFRDVISTCDAQFNTNKLGSAMTGSSAIQKLREINQQYRTLATNQSNNLRNEIKRKLIECGNAVEANNSQAGSCTPERFSTTTAGFCANAAITCANNMKSCNTQAQTFVNQIKQERTARVNNYKALVQKNKADIVRIFDTALQKYMREGEIMRGLFGAGFASPSGIQRDIQGEGKYIDKFRQATGNSPDGALLLEDPDKYVDMFKRNINLLKAEVQKQQQEIMGNGGRGGVIAQHVDQTERNYTAARRKAEEIANSCIQKHDQAIAQMEAQRQEQMKKLNELGEKRQQVCALYSRAQFDANGACSQNIGDAASAAPGAYGQLQAWCAETGYNDQGDRNSENALDICMQVASSSDSGSSTPANENANGNANTPSDNMSLPQLCQIYITASQSLDPATGCTRPVRDPNNSERTIETNVCSQMERVVMSRYRFENRGRQGNQQQGPSMPAECVAGFNGDRSVPEGSGSLMGANPMQAAMGVFGL